MDVKKEDEEKKEREEGSDEGQVTLGHLRIYVHKDVS